MSLCNCNVGLSNTGSPNCKAIMDIARRPILVPIYKDDGTINEYEVAETTFDEAFFSARVNHADASQRWFPLPDLENITDERADAEYETLNSGAKIFIRDGQRAFQGVIIQQTPEYLGKLESASCVQFGVLIIDKSGNLIGNGGSKPGFLRPIRVNKETWYPRLMKTVDSGVQKVQINFEFDANERDKNIRMVSANAITFDILNDLKGLIDVNIEDPATSITTTGFIVNLYTDFGAMDSPIAVQGFVAADFDLYNETDNASIVITSVTESSTNPGEYTFVIPAQTAGDELTLTASKDAFDCTAVDLTIDIPT